MRVRAAWLLLAIVAGCGGDEPPPQPAPRSTPEPLLATTTPAGFGRGAITTSAPADNALTEARAQLGKRLFYDSALSRTREVACASCHDQEHAFSDPRRVSIGVEGRTGTRNAPALVNLAWAQSLFWDGRARTLEEQAGKPIENPLEMDLPLPEAVARVAGDATYVAQFNDAYGGPPSDETLRKALASFVRTLVSGGSPYDRALAGDTTAMTDSEQRGEALFFGEKARCFHCHPPQALTNQGYFNNGGYEEGGDLGRQEITGRPGDRGKFRVSGLRNVAASAPYMHDGSLPTLEAVIDQYDRGGRGHASTDPQITSLGLSTAEKADLLAFLHALTDEAFLHDPRYAK
jgi:cytochrome c peroxidase